MQINSLEFFGFLAAALPLVFLFGRKWPALTFVAVSVGFYFLSDPTHLPLMLGLVGGNYWLAHRMLASRDESAKNRLFWTAITMDAGMLTLSKLMSSPFHAQLFGTEPSALHRYGLALAPVGISYIIFQLISCITDIQSGRVQERISPVDFTAFSMFFPQVTAGPLSRVSGLLPQLQRPSRFSGAAFVEGSQLIFYGLFKKLVIANNMDPLVFSIFKNPTNSLPLHLLVAVILNPIQLYADFSAYTDIARGVARLAGISLPVNFNQPYVAVSVTEFWRRWHMSLSDWLRDYVYTPLAMRFRAFGYTAICGSLIATFVICGVWHGFTLPYAIFGLFQGILLSSEVLTRRTRTRLSKSMNLRLFRLLGWIYTMTMFAIAEVFFRSQTMTQAWDVFHGLATFRVPIAPVFYPFLPRMLVVASAMITWCLIRYSRKWSPNLRVVFEGAVVSSAIIILGRTSDRPFIYANF